MKWTSWLCTLAGAMAWARGDTGTEGGDILEAMLGKVPEEAPTVRPVADVVPTPVPYRVPPNPPGCATDLAVSLDAVTRFARFTTAATADCAQPGQNSDGCADDIVSLTRYISRAVSNLADSAFTCGNVQAGCVQTIAAAIEELSRAVDAIVDMETECDAQELSCTYQVFMFLSHGLHCGKNIDTAITQCPPHDDDDFDGDGDGDDGSGEDANGTMVAPPPLTADQVAKLYPNGVPAPSPRRLLAQASLRGSGRGGSSPGWSEGELLPDWSSILPSSAAGLE